MEWYRSAKRMPEGINMTNEAEALGAKAQPILQRRHHGPIHHLGLVVVVGGGFTYWLMSRTSTVLKSKSSKKGKAASPSYAGCWPASSCTRGSVN